MKRYAVIFGLGGSALVACVVGVATAGRPAVPAESRRVPILVRCPRADDRLEFDASADQVIAMARSVNHREVTHYLAGPTRRTRWNTPVKGLVMDLRDNGLYVPGRPALASRAKKLCGKLGLASSAVTFHDGLSPICCQTFTVFVARGRDAWIVFGGRTAYW
jgi:hypothetical protein